MGAPYPNVGHLISRVQQVTVSSGAAVHQVWPDHNAACGAGRNPGETPRRYVTIVRSRPDPVAVAT